MVKKKNEGLNPVVATVLIILITVAAVTIIWAAIIPMIEDTLPYKYNITYEKCSEQFIDLPAGTKLVGYTEGDFESEFVIDISTITEVRFRYETMMCDILESNKVIAKKSVDPFGNEFYPGKFTNELTAKWLDEYCSCDTCDSSGSGFPVDGTEWECIEDCLEYSCGDYTVEAYK